jgi:HEAT repeat protein
MARMNEATLGRYLRDENAEIRRAAVLGVAMRESSAYVQRMIEMLDDPELSVVRATVAALKSLSGKDYGPGLAASQDEHDQAVARWTEWVQKRP